MLKKILTIVRQEGTSAAWGRAWAKLFRQPRSLYKEMVARRSGSYISRADTHISGLTPRLAAPAFVPWTVEQCIPQQVAEKYLDHRFDILGSGWVQVRYGMGCRGLAGYRYGMGDAIALDASGNWLAERLNSSNLMTAQRIWQRVDYHYQPIDWQLDFKSGYRWSESTWASRLTYGHVIGADVKVPWELSRMQHLLQMALRAAALGPKDVEAQRLMRDVRNQWLDFIATNPPGFGVNWLCPMDIAIRGANWCLAWDILRGAGFPLDAEDEAVLANSLYDHGRYIVEHLEWSSKRANHYLANVCGLAFIAAYLPGNRDADRWLAFGIEQLQSETLRQFLPDGGHFEGSVAYHRLSAEMVIYATALILGLPQARLARLAMIAPQDYAYVPYTAGTTRCLRLQATGTCAEGEDVLTAFESKFVGRLQQAVSFFSAILKPGGAFPQIGDNDSGRFFKVQPVYSELPVGLARRKYSNLADYSEMHDGEVYYFEEHCDGTHLLNAASGIGLHQAQKNECWGAEVSLIEWLANKRKLVPQEVSAPAFDMGEESVLSELLAEVAQHPYGKADAYELPVESFSRAVRLEYRRFPDFGLHLWKSKHVVISVRSIETEVIATKGHFHEDQLSIEITLDGVPKVRDPGTFIYTALPAERNRYRARSAHFATSSSSPDRLGAFEPPDLVPVKRLYAGPKGFVGSCRGAASNDLLVVWIAEDRVRIVTLAQVHGERVERSALMGIERLPYSPGYGIQERPD